MNTTEKRFARNLAVALLAGMSGTALAQMPTVSVLNPNPNGLTIVDSPANVGHASFLTMADMSTAVADAFNNNMGGVIDWDPANGWIANGQNALSQTVSYGTGQSKLLTISRDDGGGLNTFGPTTGSGSVPTSGDQYVGFQNMGSPMTLTFDTGLTAWGITQLNRFASRDVTISFTLADTSVISYNLQNQDPLGDNSGDLNWYGFQTTEANPLVGVTMTASGFVRFDDMAFIAVPEPDTVALAGLGLALCMGALRRRRV